MLKPIQRFFSSLRLTLFLLASSLILVFFGTLDQVHYGIYHTQLKYFEHAFVVWEYPQQWPFADALSWLHLPMPGGYILGPLLVINLIFAHFRFFRASWKKAGIGFIHAGIVLLLVGQLLTQIGQKEYFLWLAEGAQSNFVESFHYDEFVIIDTTDPAHNRVFAWDARALRDLDAPPLQHPDLPFTIETLWFARNAAIFPRPTDSTASFPPMPFDSGIGADRNLVALAQKPTFAEGERNVTSAIVRLRDRNANAPIGTWLVANIFRQSLPMREAFPVQSFQFNGRSYQIALRFTRAYLPAFIKLLDFKHDRYPGTDIPFNFSSDVALLEGPDARQRNTLIYMNHPLRYEGLTFYQASFANNDTMSMFQVVHNPARWIPYIACVITTIGLLLQFSISLFVHSFKRRA